MPIGANERISHYCLTFSANDCVFSLNGQQKVYYVLFDLTLPGSGKMVAFDSRDFVTIDRYLAIELK